MWKTPLFESLALDHFVVLLTTAVLIGLGTYATQIPMQGNNNSTDDDILMLSNKIK